MLKDPFFELDPNKTTWKIHTGQVYGVNEANASPINILIRLIGNVIFYKTLNEIIR